MAWNASCRASQKRLLQENAKSILGQIHPASACGQTVKKWQTQRNMYETSGNRVIPYKANLIDRAHISNQHALRLFSNASARLSKSNERALADTSERPLRYTLPTGTEGNTGGVCVLLTMSHLLLKAIHIHGKHLHLFRCLCCQKIHAIKPCNSCGLF